MCSRLGMNIPCSSLHFCTLPYGGLVVANLDALVWVLIYCGLRLFVQQCHMPMSGHPLVARQRADDAPRVKTCKMKNSLQQTALVMLPNPKDCPNVVWYKRLLINVRTYLIGVNYVSIYSCTYVYSYILRQLMLVWCSLLTTGSAVHCCGGRSTGCLACRVWSTSGSCTVLSS